jgi:pimeloyl-ACP methyl ester carboxylesterase
MRDVRIWVLLCLFAAADKAAAEGSTATLARKAGRPLEAIEGLTTEYGTLRMRDGVRLRTIVTKPAGAAGRLPAILFVQWLSCDTVELRAGAEDGWGQLIRGIAGESGMLVWRTEKRGIGDSEGDCPSLDYDTELGDHREALAALRRRADVDPGRIVVFGASMGATYAPLIAADQDLAGVVVWGGGATTWFERTLRFERNALELGGIDPAKLQSELTDRALFLARYLLRGESPTAIAASDPTLGKVWQRMVGTGGDSHYGRPIAFHQQAQRQDWAGAWARVRAPVLVLYGEYDWYESRDAAALIADIVNRGRPRAGTLRVIPGLDHHLVRYPDREAAFKERGGVPSAEPVVEAILGWCDQIHTRGR